MTGQRLKEQEMIYEDQVRLSKIPEMRSIVEAEVVRLEVGRLEFVVVFLLGVSDVKKTFYSWDYTKVTAMLHAFYE